MAVRASSSLWINDLFSFYFERRGIATTLSHRRDAEGAEFVFGIVLLFVAGVAATVFGTIIATFIQIATPKRA